MSEVSTKQGNVKQVIGAVVDVEFKDDLPKVYTALETSIGDKKLVLETQQHLGSGLEEVCGTVGPDLGPTLHRVPTVDHRLVSHAYQPHGARHIQPRTCRDTHLFLSFQCLCVCVILCLDAA